MDLNEQLRQGPRPRPAWASELALRLLMRRAAGSKAPEWRPAGLPPPHRRPPRPPLALALLACALIVSAHWPAAAAQPLSEGQLAQVAEQCPVSVRYAVSLGDPRGGVGAAPSVPIFVAVVTLQNNANVSWMLVRMPVGPACSEGADSSAVRRAAGRPAAARSSPPASASPHTFANPHTFCPFVLQYTIEEWRLGWRFPFESIIQQQQARGSGGGSGGRCSGNPGAPARPAAPLASP